MLFGLATGNEKIYDNSMHLHPGKRIEEHMTGSGTYGVIFSWNPIHNATGKEMKDMITIPDPTVNSKKLYIHIIPPNSNEALYLPQRTPHKFKVALHQDLWKLSTDKKLLKLMGQKISLKSKFKKSHSIIDYLQNNFDELI
ncbi:MAG: hypothetical protein AAF195_03265 [Pseudomonadota bacterium]